MMPMLMVILAGALMAVKVSLAPAPAAAEEGW